MCASQDFLFKLMYNDAGDNNCQDKAGYERDQHEPPSSFFAGLALVGAVIESPNCFETPKSCLQITFAIWHL